MNETAKRLRIGRSSIPGGGRGVFARASFAQGEKLLVTGFLVRRDSLEDHCTHYADPYKFRLGRDLLIPTGYGGLINHSACPNLMKIVAGKRVFLKTLRTIRAGEELFHKYGPNALKRFRRKPRHPAFHARPEK